MAKKPVGLTLTEAGPVPVYQLSREESRLKAKRKSYRFDIEAGERAEKALHELREACPHRVVEKLPLGGSTDMKIVSCLVCGFSVGTEGLTIKRKPNGLDDPT